MRGYRRLFIMGATLLHLVLAQSMPTPRGCQGHQRHLLTAVIVSNSNNIKLIRAIVPQHRCLATTHSTAAAASRGCNRLWQDFWAVTMTATHIARMCGVERSINIS